MENSNRTSDPISGRVVSTTTAPDQQYQEALSPLFWGQGFAVYNAETFFQHRARDSKGEFHNARIHIFQDRSVLMPWQRNDIFRLQDDVFSVVHQIAKIISGMSWQIIPTRKLEDEIADQLKRHKWIIDQIGTPSEFDLWSRAKVRISWEYLYKYLGPYELKPDLSNFQGALFMWSKDLRQLIRSGCAEIEDWLNKPHKFYKDEEGVFVESNTQSFAEFCYQCVVDMMIHGQDNVQLPNAKFDGLFELPGGSVFRIPPIKVGQREAYVQLMYGAHGYGYTEPVWFEPDQISLTYFASSSSNVNGFRPLDAIMESVATAFKYEALMGRYTNNEVPPDKVIVVVDENLSASPKGTDVAPQNDNRGLERSEEVLNAWTKNRNVRMRRERGKDVKVLDIGKQDILDLLDKNRERVRKIIGRVFGATPNEMGETGTESGMIAKAGAEAQQSLYNRQSVKPNAASIEWQATQDWIAPRFGKIQGVHGQPILREFRFSATESDAEKAAMAKSMADTRVFSRNQILTKVYGEDPSTRPEDDLPIGAAPQPQPQDIMDAITRGR